MENKRTAILTTVLFGLLAQRAALASPHCIDYTGELGNHADPYTQCEGTVFPFDLDCVQVEDPNSANVSVQNNSGAGVSEGVWAPASGIILTLADNYSPPTEVEFDLYVFDECVDVVAYDSGSNQIFSDKFCASSVHPVQIQDEGGIATIEISGGENETWVDDICLP